MPGRSRSRSRSGSRSRSDRRSKGTKRNYRSRSRSPSYMDEVFRIHVANLGIECSKREITRVFEKFGPLAEVWLARNPPCFAFVVYRHKEDAEEAIREMDGQNLCGSRVKVTSALPRNRGNAGGGYGSIGFSRRRPADPDLRCYQCGERGHFSRDCDFYGRFRSRHFSSSSRSSGSRSRSRSRTRKERRSRSRSRSHGRKKSPSPVREPVREQKRSSKERKRSNRSRSRERARKVSDSSKSHRSPSPSRDF